VLDLAASHLGDELLEIGERALVQRGLLEVAVDDVVDRVADAAHQRVGGCRLEIVEGQPE